MDDETNTSSSALASPAACMFSREHKMRARLRRQVFLENEDVLIALGKHGQFAIVLQDYSLRVAETERDALEFVAALHGGEVKEAFIARIGGGADDATPSGISYDR